MDEIQLEKVLKALASKRRLLIIKILKKKKRSSVGKLSSDIKLSFRTTSKHLSVLYSVGILDKEQVGYEMHYYIAKDLPKIVYFVLNLL